MFKKIDTVLLILIINPYAFNFMSNLVWLADLKCYINSGLLFNFTFISPHLMFQFHVSTNNISQLPSLAQYGFVWKVQPFRRCQPRYFLIFRWNRIFEQHFLLLSLLRQIKFYYRKWWCPIIKILWLDIESIFNKLSLMPPLFMNTDLMWWNNS